MKHCKSALLIVGALSTMLMNGCKSDDLDLGDIDTTMKFDVNDLVLPVKLYPIQFRDMIDLTDNDDIKEFNGEYVLLKEGDFKSEEINIRPIFSDATVNVETPQIPVFIMTAGSIVDLPDMNFSFSYSYDEVDKYIKRIDSGVLDVYLTFKIIAKDGNLPMDCIFRNMVFTLPKGFYGTINGKTVDRNSSNEVKVDDAGPNSQGEYIVTFHVTSFDYEESGAKYEPETRNFSLSNEFKLKDGGYIEMLGGNGNTGSLETDFTVSKMELKTFTGRVYYELADLNVDDILLDNDVLTDPNTHLGLKNPQLYVALSNPLANYGITGSAGLTIKQSRADVEDKDAEKASLREDLVIASTEGTQNFCLSPIDPKEKVYDKYPGAKWCEMVNLGNIVNGNGLPQGLKIEFQTPKMNEKDVVDFKLGENYEPVKGTYTFFAPLELSEGSHIYYEEEATGWDLSNDDNHLDIKQISLTAKCISDLPVKVTITATPLNSNGDEIPGLENQSVKVPAYGNQDIEFLISGDIKDLDGMRYLISIDAGQKTDVLKPTMKLKLDNLKLKVSGSYIIDPNDDDND